MSISDIISIQDKLTALSSNATVRQLLSQVTQDAQNETLSTASSEISVKFNVIYREHQEARREILSVLNSLMYLLLTEDRFEDLYIRTFLFENHTRLQKLLVLARICEHSNLASFGTPEAPVVPQLSDVPQCIVVLSNRLEQFKAKILAKKRKFYEDTQLSKFAKTDIGRMFSAPE